MADQYVRYPSLAGSGGVAGPASATDTAIAIYNGTTGKIIKNSAATIDGSGNITATNISGTNTGDITLAAVGSSPSANGASLSSQVLTLQPADGTHPGLLSIASQTIAGAKTFSSPAILTGVTDASSAASGVVGEIIEYNQGTFTNFPGGTGVYGDIQTVALTAGDWDCSYSFVIDSNGATVTQFITGLGTATGDNTTGMVAGKTRQLSVPSANIGDACLTSPTFRISISGATNFFLKLRGSFSIATPQYTFYFSARRAR